MNTTVNIIASLLALACGGHAATWYATSSTVSINTAGLWVPASTTTCAGSGTALVWGSQANGDVFDANGCTALAVNVDPGSVSVHVTLTTAGSGGAFTYATASALTIHAHIVSGASTCLAISGSSGGGTIIGNVQGGSGSSINGVSDGHTGGTNTITVTGNVTGGSNTSAVGYLLSNSGALAVTGDATAGSGATSHGLSSTSVGTVTLTGACVGSNSAVSYGCSNSSTGTFTVTGNLIFGLRGAATVGGVRITPGATNYALFPKDGSYALGTIDTHAVEMPLAPGVGNVRAGVQYGSLTGTLAATSNAYAAPIQ